MRTKPVLNFAIFASLLLAPALASAQEFRPYPPRPMPITQGTKSEPSKSYLEKNTLCRFEAPMTMAVRKPDGSTARTTIETGAHKVACEGGYGLAAAFDGFNLRVYDLASDSFTSFSLVGYTDMLEYGRGVEVSAGVGIAGAYTGLEFAVYDQTTKQLVTSPANRGSVYARISAGEKIVVLYDGDDYIVYNRDRGTFEKFLATSDSSNVVIVAGRENAALFDGTVATLYCEKTGKTQTVWINPQFRNVRAKPVVGIAGATVGLQIDRATVTLNSDCVMSVTGSPARNTP